MFHRKTQTLFLLVLLGLLSVGCSLRKPKDVVPVVGPPPPRYSYNNDAPSSLPLTGLAEEPQSSADTQLINVSLNTSSARTFQDTKTVAYVNGEPILAAEILEPYAEKLVELKSKVPPAQFHVLRTGLIKRDLPIQIDNRLLIQGFKSGLKKPQQEALDAAITGLFGEEIEKLKQQFQVNTDYELELELQKKNSSLTALERAFGNRVMASEFLKTKAGAISEPTRQELLKEYHRIKQEEFHRPAKVRWQQILISYGANGGKQGAIQELTKAAAELRNGTDFSDVAETYSDGPGATQGGYWDWMQRGSLADTALEEALFSLPVAQISDVFVNETGVQVVRVLEREQERYLSFEDVQENLKDDLMKASQKVATERVMGGLRETAVIQTIFDEQEALPEFTNTQPSQQKIEPVNHTSPQLAPRRTPAVVPGSPNPFEEPAWASGSSERLEPQNKAVSPSSGGENSFQSLSNPFE